MKDIKEIYVSLPSSWKELKFKDYQKLYGMNHIDSNDILNDWNLKTEIVSRLTGVSIDDLLSMPINDVGVLIYRISFFNQLPERDKSFKLKVKPMNKISTDSYLQFLQTVDRYGNMKSLVKTVSYLTEEEIDNLNMEQCWQFFFVLSNHWSKYTKRMLKPFLIKELKNKLTPTLFKKKTKQ